MFLHGNDPSPHGLPERDTQHSKQKQMLREMADMPDVPYRESPFHVSTKSFTMLTWEKDSVQQMFESNHVFLSSLRFFFLIYKVQLLFTAIGLFKGQRR